MNKVKYGNVKLSKVQLSKVRDAVQLQSVDLGPHLVGEPIRGWCGPIGSLGPRPAANSYSKSLRNSESGPKCVFEFWGFSIRGGVDRGPHFAIGRRPLGGAWAPRVNPGLTPG